MDALAPSSPYPAMEDLIREAMVVVGPMFASCSSVRISCASAGMVSAILENFVTVQPASLTSMVFTYHLNDYFDYDPDNFNSLEFEQASAFGDFFPAARTIADITLPTIEYSSSASPISRITCPLDDLPNWMEFLGFLSTSDALGCLTLDRFECEHLPAQITVPAPLMALHSLVLTFRGCRGMAALLTRLVLPVLSSVKFILEDEIDVECAAECRAILATVTEVIIAGSCRLPHGLGQLFRLMFRAQSLDLSGASTAIWDEFRSVSNIRAYVSSGPNRYACPKLRTLVAPTLPLEEVKRTLQTRRLSRYSAIESVTMRKGSMAPSLDVIQCSPRSEIILLFCLNPVRCGGVLDSWSAEVGASAFKSELKVGNGALTVTLGKNEIARSARSSHVLIGWRAQELSESDFTPPRFHHIVVAESMRVAPGMTFAWISVFKLVYSALSLRGFDRALLLRLFGDEGASSDYGLHTVDQGPDFLMIESARDLARINWLWSYRPYLCQYESGNLESLWNRFQATDTANALVLYTGQPGPLPYMRDMPVEIVTSILLYACGYFFDSRTGRMFGKTRRAVQLTCWSWHQIVVTVGDFWSQYYFLPFDIRARVLLWTSRFRSGLDVRLRFEDYLNYSITSGAVHSSERMFPLETLTVLIPHLSSCKHLALAAEELFAFPMLVRAMIGIDGSLLESFTLSRLKVSDLVSGKVAVQDQILFLGSLPRLVTLRLQRASIGWGSPASFANVITATFDDINGTLAPTRRQLAAVLSAATCLRRLSMRRLSLAPGLSTDVAPRIVVSSIVEMDLYFGADRDIVGFIRNLSLPSLRTLSFQINCVVKCESLLKSVWRFNILSPAIFTAYLTEHPWQRAHLIPLFRLLVSARHVDMCRAGPHFFPAFLYATEHGPVCESLEQLTVCEPHAHHVNEFLTRRVASYKVVPKLALHSIDSASGADDDMDVLASWMSRGLVTIDPEYVDVLAWVFQDRPV
ncbi:hypothetical protein C8R46DRAFT_1034142 [Mycena filopes]|nr:hypothetical protein C8R46DRAFT_1034142 [Mycena filopes]